MGTSQSKAVQASSQASSTYIFNLLIYGYLELHGSTPASVVDTAQEIIDLCRAYYLCMDRLNLLFYVHTISMIQAMDLNDANFTKYVLDIYLLDSEQRTESLDSFQNRVYNRCFCSYALASNVQFLPSWIDALFLNNRVPLLSTRRWSMYSVIFRCGGYYFDEYNNIDASQLSDDLEILVMDMSQFLFAGAGADDADAEHLIHTYCVSVPCRLPSRHRYRMVYNAHNQTLLFTPYIGGGAPNNNYADEDDEEDDDAVLHPAAFVYELDLETLQWRVLIEYDDEDGGVVYGAHLCVVQNGAGLVQIGGVDVNGEKLTAVKLYSYAEQRNTEILPPMTHARTESMCCVYDAVHDEILVAGGMRDKYHENKIEILSLKATAKKWFVFPYIFNHNHREPLLWLHFANNKQKQKTYIAGNELDNFKRIGYVESIDLRRNHGKTIVEKWQCVGGGGGGGNNNTAKQWLSKQLDKAVAVSIKQMFEIQMQTTPRVTLLHTWL
eukprot:CAMPEP_0202686898 /NCGR_PEP_ID=MMETSP1385-20130828/2658_1 /ASSEMBLY_ACC=CAM_ASM_000861 /TAXON_ID=933848 /ORGANISM="Elphidium margaritaceum" /LENGTH=494 /DNA_ID=CAMNT_0049341573 /DNA_START=23 /DNA_END=1507 /DNA_ORIENTATION=+